jgi:calcium-dependent protein kinase
MGNQHMKRRKTKGKNKDGKESNTTNETGEDYYLEDWDVVNDKNKDLNYSVKFGNDLLIKEVKKDPYADYDTIKILGEGSFGKVVLVSHKITGAIRAMKIIEKVDDLIESNDQDVLNEINILKKIDLPSIIKIFEFYVDDKNYYLITEYCSGGELYELINDYQFSEMRVAYIMYQLFLGLNYCHKMKIIHRDLKPENILLTKNEDYFLRIKICDFGTSQIFKRGDVQKDIVGSLFYMAPEVIQQNYNFKCDLWSCGVIMYILLTNRLPFAGENDDEIISNILHSEYNTFYLKDFSENTKDLLKKLLERDVNKRINAEDALKHKFFEEFKAKEKFNEIKDENKISKFINNLKNYKRKSILQETTIAYLVHNCTDLDDVEDANNLFDKIDVYGKGKISLDDFYIGLACLVKDENLKQEDFVEIFANLDTDKDNYLGYEDFVRGAIDKNCLLDDKILKFAFQYFDKDNNGEITISEISIIFKEHLNTGDVEKGLKKILSEVDEDGNGKITYEKFCKLMKNLIM